MSVVVIGMEMPPRCLNCPFKQFLLLGERNICLANGGKLIKYTDFSERDKDCPLVSLPEKHGRLIDAEALMERIDKCWINDGWWVEGKVDETPTVVEAEGEE